MPISALCVFRCDSTTVQHVWAVSCWRLVSRRRRCVFSLIRVKRVSLPLCRLWGTERTEKDEHELGDTWGVYICGWNVGASEPWKWIRRFHEPPGNRKLRFKATHVSLERRGFEGPPPSVTWIEVELYMPHRWTCTCSKAGLMCTKSVIFRGRSNDVFEGNPGNRLILSLFQDFLQRFSTIIYNVYMYN